MLIYLQTIETEEDKSKFEDIYREYRGLMYYVAYKRLHHEQDAEDAVHYAFMKIAENIKIIDPVSPKTKQLVVTIVDNRVTDIQQYQYEVLPVTDELRETLFTTFFGARASEAIYDQRNDVWELHNSEAIGDYYLYEHTIAMAGESVPGEEIFTLGYRDVNLYPFEDNLLSSSAECGVSIPLEDVISLCGTITDAIAPQNSYTADTVLPYGNQGRRPYYTIFFRRTAGGMPIIGYNDLYFLVDSNGIQTISGALYGLTAQPLSSELLSLEDAVASLRENTSLIDFYGEDTLSVGAISLEYIVTLTETQEAVAIPAWRFQIGTNDNSLMINRRRVLAVNAVTGELIQGERGRSF